MGFMIFKLVIFTAFVYVLHPLAVSSNQSSHRVLQYTAHSTDMELLLRFKQQVQQDPHGVLASWSSPSSNGSAQAGADVCTWNGVTCSASHRVVKLELRDADLEGLLTFSTFMAMDMLELVDLSGNYFHGDLASALRDGTSGVGCGNLQTVILANNDIHGTLPSDLLTRTCGNVQHLDISNNNLTGSLSDSFFQNCGSLEMLDLSHNQLKSGLPAGIGGECTNLRHLNLSHNILSGVLPSEVFTSTKDSSCNGEDACSSTSNLQVLDLSFNNLSGSLTDSVFRECGSLISINLSHNAFSSEVPRSITNCAALQVLDLSNNKFVSSVPPSLGELKYIKSLDLSENLLSGDIPDELGIACSTLQRLDLSANNITGTLPSSLRSCFSLQTLNLAKNKLSGKLPGAILSQLKGLQNLNLGFNHFTGTLPIEVILDCRNLKLLDLSSNLLAGELPSDICPPSSSLQTLLLPNNRFWGKLPSAIGNCSQLRVLDLSFNALEGTIPAEIGLISGLESLLIWYNRFNGEIPKELGALSGLKTLVLNNNYLDGSIPLELSNLSAMEWMCLSNNKLTGSIPAFLGALPHLTILELANNSLSGHIPLELENATKFIWVDLNSNYLDGPIPERLGRHPFNNVTRLHYEFAFVRNLGYKCRGLGILLEYAGITEDALSATPLRTSCNLTRLYVEDSLNGDSDFSTIQYLDLSFNMLGGTIPEAMGYLTALQMLSLAHNQLVGPIPASFSHLKNIGVLDLSFNHLEGGLWPLANCTFLVQIDVSNNNLSGEIPNAGQLPTAPAAGFLNNTGLCGEPLPPCNASSLSPSGSVCKHDGTSCSGHNPRLGVFSWANSVVLSLLIAVAFICTLIVWGLLIRSKRAADRRQKDDGLSLGGLHLGAHFHETRSTWNIAGEKEPLSINVATFERPLRKLTFAQLIEATNGFSPESLIGVGGFGEVYKAVLADGSVVAIKKLLQTSYQGDREFIAEMETLGKIKHKNLVPLLGYCKVGEERLLVYEYMDGGSLEDMLHGDDEAKREKLTWEKRKQIAKGAARGLAFLHHNCIPHIIHRDMKSSNVLLDGAMEARVSDFGMARLISASDTHLSVSTLAGTPGYVPPEYCHSFRCTTKGDVYSFGVVLLELLTGRRPTSSSCDADPNHPDNNLLAWVHAQKASKRAFNVLDPRLTCNASPSDHFLMLQYLRLACDCVEELPLRRPSMQHVLTMMKEMEVG
ncbi:hypothetical protein KP509_38G044500 [Ceratopteris richardii]|uniref:non-specific serine/threonine protein kinase n=1 Tax=Ceratopteris richardii TaxID=49495 RepID=A0A8T2Q3K0_CERRI|nr:hypothetical protein KP509_38G044500 [Ceratopteris richardii]